MAGTGKDSKRILLNAANLATGGGVQVAVSVIAELLAIGNHLPPGLHIWASSVVDADLRRAGYDPQQNPAYEVVDVHGMQGFVSRAYRRLRDFDRVFTVFGPLYAILPPRQEITGFALSQILAPESEALARLGWRSRLTRRLKTLLQVRLFRRADLLVVELEHVARGLARSGIKPDTDIEVVRNCVNAVFFEPGRWAELAVDVSSSRLKIGYLGRNYPHKNTAILPMVREILARQHGIDVDFFVTFTDSEWDAAGQAFRNATRNVGPLALSQCPNFYGKMDAVIFPSLLECFSAMPLESLAMGKLLFASDRDFVRDTCGDYAVYFDPLDPVDIAAKIAENVGRLPLPLANIEEMKAHVLGFSTASDRAQRILALLTEARD